MKKLYDQPKMDKVLDLVALAEETETDSTDKGEIGGGCTGRSYHPGANGPSDSLY